MNINEKYNKGPLSSLSLFLSLSVHESVLGVQKNTSTGNGVTRYLYDTQEWMLNMHDVKCTLPLEGSVYTTCTYEHKIYYIL